MWNPHNFFSISLISPSTKYTLKGGKMLRPTGCGKFQE